MSTQITTSLMFFGNAEEAINLYISLFENSRIKRIDKYGSDEEGGDEGMVKEAIIILNNTEFKFIDSKPIHDFDFTPSISLQIECETEEEVDKLFSQLSEDGKIMMPLEQYPFSKKYAWVSDRFGVSWQIVLTEK